MSDFYAKQITVPLIGTKIINKLPTGNADPTFVISAATLTAAYSGNISSALNCKGMSQLILVVQYTAGTNPTSMNLKFEYSEDDADLTTPVNWFQENSEQVLVGTTNEYLQVRKFDNNASLVAATTYKFRIVVPIADKFFRVSVQETLSSGVTFGTCYVEAVISGK